MFIENPVDLLEFDDPLAIDSVKLNSPLLFRPSLVRFEVHNDAIRLLTEQKIGLPVKMWILREPDF